MFCESCGASVPSWPATPCANCPERFSFRYDLSAAAARMPLRPTHMWEFANLLPLADRGRAVSLGEGGTPLLPARTTDLGCQAYWKLESLNPTGSQKDRALSVSISRAAELGFHRVIIASTGSAGLSCAAYCARAGLGCVVVVPQGMPAERLLPMQGYGARLVEMKGTFRHIEDLLDRVRATGGWFDATTKRSANPFHPEGPKTIAYEIAGQMDGAPEWVLVPVGGGATLYGIWRGFVDLEEMGIIARVPRMVSVQPRTFNALEEAMERNLCMPEELASIARDERVPTVQRNLKHGLPPDAADALQALRESDGMALSVTDDDALVWQRRLGETEGVLCEPSAAVAAAGLVRLRAEGVIGNGHRVVAVITGSGLRETASLGDPRLIRVTPDTGATDLEALVEQLQT